MTKTAITAADLTLLRSDDHAIDDIRLNVFRLESVASATINSTPSSNPASELVVTGNVTATELGQRFIIRDTSSNLVTHGTLRKATSGQTLYISPISIGESGYVSPIKRAISATDTITVYKDRPLWGDYSRIVNSTFRKLWDKSYSDENDDPPPIANTGASQSARISVGGSATFTLPRLGTNDSFAFGSKTISSYLWTLPTGVTLGAGYATSDSVIEVSATVGQHVLKLTVTDSNSKTHTSYVYLFVSDGVTYSDLFEGNTATIESDTQDVNGRTISFTVRGTSIEDTIPPASYIHLQHDSSYSGSALTTGVDVDTFIGYVTDYNYSHDGEYGQAQITAVSPYLYLKSVFMPSQRIVESASPTNWTQVTSDLSNPRGALCYNRWQCQNLFSMHDIDANSLTTPRKLSYDFNGKTVSSGLDVAAQAIAGNVGSASDGTIVLRYNPVYENNTFRNALATGMTIDEDDVIAPLDHPNLVVPPYADIRTGAFTYGGGGIGGVKGYYGVKRWSQGASETVLPEFTVTKSDGKSAVLEKVGHIASEAQYPLEQTITLARNINVIDPAYMIWYQLNIDAEFDPKGEGWANIRYLPRRVNRTWNTEELTLTVQATIKRETFGQAADEWIPGSGTTVVTGGWVTDLGLDYTPTTEDYSVLPNVALAYNTDGNLAITQSFTSANPAWVSLDDYITGAICDVCFDYNSAFFTSGYVNTEPLSVYIASISGTSLFVYRLYDIKASTFEVSLLTTYTMNDSSCDTGARIQCSQQTGTFAIVAWHDQTGVLVGRSSDGGATWGTAVQVGNTVADVANDNAEIGLYVSGTNQLVTAPDGSINYDTYLATTAGGSFTKLTNSEANTAPQPMITGDGATTLYVATNNNGLGSGSSPDYSVLFEGSDDTYANQTNGWDSEGEDAAGNGGGNAAYGLFIGSTSPSTKHSYIVIQVDTADTILAGTSVHATFDVYFANDLYNNVTPRTVNIDTQLILRTSGLVIVDTDTNIYDSASAGSNDDFVFTKQEEWNQVTHDIASASGNFRYIECYLGNNTRTSSGDIYGHHDNTHEMRMDNIRIYLDGGGGGSVIDPLLYKVTTYTTTDAWTDVTPATDYIPLLPYGLATDIVSAANVETMANNGTTQHWYGSTNTATSWTDNGVESYVGVKRLGDALILFGTDALDLSFDNGATLTDKLGNLDSVMTVGTLKNVLVLV